MGREFQHRLAYMDGGLKGFGSLPDYTVSSQTELLIFLDAAVLCQSRHSKSYDKRRQEGKLKVPGYPTLRGER